MTLHFRSFQVDFIAFLTFLLKVSREGKRFSFCDKWRTGIREKEKENIFFCYFRMCAYFHLLKYFYDFYILMRRSPWYFGTIFQWMTGFPFLVWVFVTAYRHSKAPTLWAVWQLWFKCYMSFTGPCVYTCSPAGGTVWKGCRTFGREPVWRTWGPPGGLYSLGHCDRSLLSECRHVWPFSLPLCHLTSLPAASPAQHNWLLHPSNCESK